MSSAAGGIRSRRPELSDEQRTALRDSAWAWLVSRALCWIAAVAAILIFGADAGPHDPRGYTEPFSEAGDVLVGAAARWDTVWYIEIADEGYRRLVATTFYPLYPMAAKVVGVPVGSTLVGGILVSLAALLGALYLLQRLTALELGKENGRRAMLLLAFFPTAVFLSAVYTEALCLVASIGAVYAARTGRWAWAGTAAALACLTRPTSFILLFPLALFYLYGPRTDRPPDADAAGVRPRYRLRPDAAWLLGVPAGLGAYMAYLWAEFGDPLAMTRSGANWDQHFTIPLETAARATGRALTGALEVFEGKPPNDVYEFGFFLLACVAAVGAFRRLPIAYSVYIAAGVLVIASFPIRGESLSSFSRYMLPLFPVLMWLAAWTSERRLFRLVLVLFAIAMVVNAGRFATWHFVA